jgi:inhibitor of KinA
MKNVRILNCGDKGILLEFSSGVSPKINRRIQNFYYLIREANIPGIVEGVFGFRTLLIYYDPLMIELETLKKEIRQIEERIEASEETFYEKRKKVEIPVAFGGEFGPDLNSVAQLHRMKVENVIELFQRPEYVVYMYAFAPGHPLLARLPRRIVTPRLKTPRLKVPVGTIGIGNMQVGIYAQETPGGLQLIGRTPLKIYDPTRELLSIFLNIGDTVKFKSIDENEYCKIALNTKSELSSYIIEN